MGAVDILGEKELAEIRKLKVNLGDELKQANYGSVGRDSKAASMRFDVQNIDEYEVQYDPNNDFAIFGIGDPTRGGVQSMKEKMNQADDVKDSDSSSDDSDTIQRKDSKLSTQVQTNVHPSSRGSG